MLDEIERVQAELDKIERLIATEDALRETLPDAQVDATMDSWRKQAEELRSKIAVLGDVTDSQITQGRDHKVAQAHEGGIAFVNQGGKVEITLVGKDQNAGEDEVPTRQPSLAPLIAHEYTLDRTYGFVGRQIETQKITIWARRADSPSILNVVAIGGMGKSALTWHWFNEMAPEVIEPLAGRLWWSFYERGATFEQFLTRALAYVSQQSLKQAAQIPRYEQERQLLDILNQRPFLVVLDGLERILLAYARHDAAYLRDDDSSLRSDDYRMSKAADWRVGNFLRRLTTIKASRILVSTRLYPADLRDKYTGDMIPNSYLELGGLSDDDALALWAKMGLSGEHFELLRLFHTFDNHPLVLQAFAGAIKRYRRAPNNFKQWAKDHPAFNPFDIRNVQKAMAHVLGFALGTLSAPLRQTLHTIAAFRMPATYDTLTALLVGKNKPFANPNVLDSALSELEERGLLGWDKQTNQYDLHPIVRGVTWSNLDDTAKKGIYNTLHIHFNSQPKIREWRQVSSLEELATTVELYSTLIGLERYEDAYNLFRGLLDKAMLNNLNASRQSAELLEMLFPNEIAQSLYLSNDEKQVSALNMLGNAYEYGGQLERATNVYRLAIDLAANMPRNTSISMCNLADVLYQSGMLYNSEFMARQALLLNRQSGSHFGEAASLAYGGRTLASQGVVDNAKRSLRRALTIFQSLGKTRAEGFVHIYLAQLSLWLYDIVIASSFADCALKIAQNAKFKRRLVSATWLQGIVALGLGKLDLAERYLFHALTGARAVNLVREELPALVALAELRRQQGNPTAARDLLDDVWEPAERGPYPLFHADALNVLAQIERDAGNVDAAIRAATQAYRLAWCDGPPFTYHWGLQKTKAHLTALGAPFPDLPAFDPSKYEPMPEVEINPLDEFHVSEPQF